MRRRVDWLRRRVSEAFERFGLEEPDQPASGPPVGYKECAISVVSCHWLLDKVALIPAFGNDATFKAEVIRAVELGRYYELPLNESSPWLDVSSAAAQQGVDEADIVFDRAGRHHEPAAPRKRKTT